MTRTQTPLHLAIAFFSLSSCLLQAEEPGNAAEADGQTKIEKLYFMFHPVCWSMGMQNGKPPPLPDGDDPQDYLACYQREQTVIQRQKDFISAMKPNEALIVFPIGRSPEMLDLEEHATRALGPRCVILRRKSVDPPAEWAKLPDPFAEFLDNDKLPGKETFLQNVPANIQEELRSEIRAARQSLGGKWSVALLEVLYMSRLHAMDMEDEFANRNLYYDPQTVQSEAFGEGFEECAMTWKAMLVPYLGLAAPADNNFDLSVGALRLLVDAEFKERVALNHDVRLYLWQTKDGRPIGFFARSWCRLNEPQYYAKIPLDGAALEVWTQTGHGTKLWPAADTRLKEDGDELLVPVLNGIRRDDTDGAFYLSADGMSFDEFRQLLVGVQLTK